MDRVDFLRLHGVLLAARDQQAVKLLLVVAATDAQQGASRASHP
jgi:hypothetical protein